MKLFLIFFLAGAPKEPPRSPALSIEDCLRLARQNTGWQKQRIAYAKKALDIWHEVLQSPPERGIKEETERGLLRVIEEARADILG